MTTANHIEVLDRLTALGDGTRTRVLLLLERQELTVSELCAVLQAPQSTVSRHLKALADASWVVSRPLFKKAGRLVPGQLVVLNTSQGQKQVTVVKVGRFNVDVDTNHPLAGQSLTFEVEISDVRDATKEEVSHGHPHLNQPGPG